LRVSYKYSVVQKGDSVAKKLAGLKIIKNKKQMHVSVADTMHGVQSRYSKWDGTNYALADIITRGTYAPGGKKRPFMYEAMKALKADRKFTKDFRRFCVAKKRGGVEIDWDMACLWTKSYVQQAVARGSLGLAPISKESQLRRMANGHGAQPPVYASGELCKAITAWAE
jgi:hypothetical protein